ncbi:HAD-IIA family hydrolase [Tomitella fengzijianii]|uniref:HAD-IIA family hydrolase n=1 Tax=Tomitella fengzijianii TaxID=2597660 RepID=UPI001E2CAD3B|nr:HAD-IIA family hydrolase [Tomitella fengzijianii]
MLDLDGTVYRGSEPIVGAESALAASPSRHLFVTNNASRSPEDVAEHLNALGIHAEFDDVVTSAQAGARLVASRLGAGAEVLVVGAPALADEVLGQGLRPVRSFSESVAAVIQGFSRSVAWSDLAEAALAVRNGAWWVATNVDSTLPDERGLLPGNGSLVAALATATGATPTVAGKPGRPIMDDAVRQGGGRRPLVVGDRLDTDIAGACAAGLDSLLVFTGVSTPAETILAAPAMRPTYVADSLHALAAPAQECAVGPQRGWHAQVDGDMIRVEADREVLETLEEQGGRVVDGPGQVAASSELSMRGLRAVAAVAWKHDFQGRIVGADPRIQALVRQWHGA